MKNKPGNMKKIFKIILVVIVCYIGYSAYTNYRYSTIHARNENQKINVDRKFNVSFSKEGIENIVLITMVKDEADVIYENLVWHFSIGFRKFVIVDNNSSDGTKELIEKFAEITKEKAKVFIIQDPVYEYIQSRIMTGAYLFANSVWPDLEWIFPVDADEFWVPEKNLETIINSVPSNVDALLTSCARHLPTNEYYKSDQSLPFYDKIQNRKKDLHNNLGKVAFRNKGRTVTIAQGNHSIESHFSNLDKMPKILQKAFSKYGIVYESGNSYGLQMTEYPFRSVEQVDRKFSNGMKANLIAQKKGLISNGAGFHWNKFADLIKEHKTQEAAAKYVFESEMISDFVHDPLPIEEAFKHFDETVNIK